ncbi:MAG: hypothetical protein K6B46_03010 [Opitutales bacterium]|nr:hypothetical protein [Opitutales bacterium]
MRIVKMGKLITILFFFLFGGVLKAESKISQSALLFFIPELSDRDISSIGSVSIEAYENSNMKYENNEDFHEKKLSNDWTEYSYKTSIFSYDYDGYKRLLVPTQKTYRIKVVKLNEKEDIYLCAWVEPVSGSICLHSGGFIFSVIKRPILFEGKKIEHHFIVYLGSLTEKEIEKHIVPDDKNFWQFD